MIREIMQIIKTLAWASTSNSRKTEIGKKSIYDKVTELGGVIPNLNQLGKVSFTNEV